jgi:hypothetical protein
MMGVQWRVAWTAFLLVLVGGCGTVPGSGTILPKVSPPIGALAAWQTFPADRVPRPIVLLDELPRSPGFSTNDGKIATMCHGFGPPAQQLQSDAPANATASWADGTRVTYPAISATDAYLAMSRPPVNGPGAMCATASPLAATAARLGTFGFMTDRGTAQMTAWLFTVPGALGELAYPAIVATAFWGNEATVGWFGETAAVSADGLVLTFGFAGSHAGTGPCDAEYRSGVAESLSAVAVSVQAIRGQVPAGSVMCDLVAYPRSVTVTLARPLNGRIVVDASGHIASVCRAHVPPSSPGFGWHAC